MRPLSGRRKARAATSGLGSGKPQPQKAQVWYFFVPQLFAYKHLRLKVEKLQEWQSDMSRLQVPWDDLADICHLCALCFQSGHLTICYTLAQHSATYANVDLSAALSGGPKSNMKRNLLCNLGPKRGPPLCAP